MVPVEGEFVWISIDVRSTSLTYGKLTETRLRPGNNAAYFASRGFAHGFMNFDDNTQILIAVDNDYSEVHGVGFKWDDIEIDYHWPLQENYPIILKDEHRNYDSFAEFKEMWSGF